MKLKSICSGVLLTQITICKSMKGSDRGSLSTGLRTTGLYLFTCYLLSLLTKSPSKGIAPHCFPLIKFTS